MLQHALEEEGDGGKVGAVGHFSDSSAASEPAGKSALAIDDSRARVARPGEGTRLGVSRQDGGLLRHLTGLALEVDPGERTDGVEASDGEVGGVAALDDHNARVVVVVSGLRARLPHLLGDSAVEVDQIRSFFVKQGQNAAGGRSSRTRPNHNRQGKNMDVIKSGLNDKKG